MTTIEAGEIERFATGQQQIVRVNSGEVQLSSDRRTLEKQIITYTPDYGPISWTPHDDETLYIRAVETSDVDVQYNDGFSINLFGFPVLDINSNDPNRRDFRNRTQRIPAEGVVEVNADITGFDSPLNGTNSQTSTVTADPDEVWELQSVKLFAPNADAAGASPDTFFDVATEAQDIELAFADEAGNPLRYESGQWVLGNNTRDGFDNTRIDADNGIAVTFSSTDAERTDQTIQIRFGFRVLRT